MEEHIFYLVIGIASSLTYLVFFNKFVDFARNSSEKIKLFSIPSLLSYFMGFGWCGAAFRYQLGWEQKDALLVAIAFGAGMFFISAALLAKVRQLSLQPQVRDAEERISAVAAKHRRPVNS